MLQNNSQIDPIVEILRLAYRRGLAIQQGKERNESGNPTASQSCELANQRQIDAAKSLTHTNLIDE